MFEVYCVNHASRVLLTTSRITMMRNLDGGDILVGWRCWCGQEGRLLNGRTLTDPVPLSAVAVPADCDDPDAWPDAS